MKYLNKIVLHCPDGYNSQLDQLVEKFIQDGVKFVAVAGKDCSKVEDIVDELVVGDGSRDYHIFTSSHPGESVEQAAEFARSLSGEFQGTDVQVVVL